LLEGFGIRGHTLQTVPNRGRMALLSRLADRERRKTA
jgi:carotenoid phi-ring synthase / carotenoid chi-ring synthase